MGRKWRQRYYGYGQGSQPKGQYLQKYDVEDDEMEEEEEEEEQQDNAEGQGGQDEYLHSSICSKRMNRLCGYWSDHAQSSYMLERGEKDTIDVTTTRVSGQVIKSKALIRIEWWEDYGRIVWGRGGGRTVYILDDFSRDSITWSRPGSKSFTWTRDEGPTYEDAAEDDDDEEEWEWEEEEEEEEEEEPAVAPKGGRANFSKAKGQWQSWKGKGAVESWSSGKGSELAQSEAAWQAKQQRARMRQEAKQKRRELKREFEAKEKEVAEQDKVNPAELLVARVDPFDGKPITLLQLRERYGKQYTEQELLRYWREDCTPCSPAGGKAQSSGVAKLTPVAETVSQERSKAASASTDACTEALLDALGAGGRKPQRADEPAAAPVDSKVAASPLVFGNENGTIGILSTPEPEQSQPQSSGQEYAPNAEAENPAQGISTPEPEQNQPKAMEPQYAASIEARLRFQEDLVKNISHRVGYGMPPPPPPPPPPPVVTTQPVNSQTVSTQPVTAQPVSTQPVNSQPVNSQPVNSQPVNSQPVNSQPVNSQPVNSQPVITQPMATHMQQSWQQQPPGTWMGWPAWEVDVREVAKTLEYYFSETNLRQDVYLRGMMMPTTGWVSLAMLQTFPRMRTLGVDAASMQQAVRQTQSLELDSTNCYVRIRSKFRREIWARAPTESA